jgi:hypothetical protein
MSSDTGTPSAQILDFTEYRRRRALHGQATIAPKRQFLWSWWPASGHVSLVEFPSPATPASPLSRSR